MPTCTYCGSALAAPLAPGEVCVLNPEGTAYEHKAPTETAEHGRKGLIQKAAARWSATAAEIEAAPEPAMGEDEFTVKPKRRGK